MSTTARQRRHSFPLLSPTFQSHQLWTPLYLDRITISDPHYHGYLERNVQKEQPHLNLVSRRVQKFGDNSFFMHKDIPVEQLYNRTVLKRSDVRPWDDIIPRPLKSPQIMNSELHLPYPKNHPFSSHISQFAVFPNTQSDYREVDLQTVGAAEESDDLLILTEERSTQTDHARCKPEYLSSNAPYQTVIQQKAFSRGMRIEDVSFQRVSMMENKPGVYWQIPRTAYGHPALHHQRSLTYPAPRSMYCSSAGSFLSRPLTVNTHQALLAVNQQMSQRTTYKDQFPCSAKTSQCSSLMTSRCQSAADYRGKYSRKVNFSFSLPPQQQHQLSTTDSITQKTLSQQLADTSNASYVGMMETAHEQQACAMVDKATQTDYYEEQDDDNKDRQETDEENELERLLVPKATNKIKVDLEPVRPPSLESFLFSEMSRPTSAPVGYTSTAIRPFSQMEAQQKYYSDHPETMPDLREMAVRTGKRHTFSGYHAHYWH